ncbi:MAG: AAA family ATPase [Bacteriovoracaceae bacterium]|jgi:flagellar biosynthesis protein FlhG|nr:AAA family ATPase [Bacteriovoracaceae bacterium]
MEKASEWLLSFNSQESDHVNYLINQRKNKFNKTITASITGGKGGVGKTSISLKLSKELSKLGFKVLLIDCDSNLSNTAIKLGLPLNNTFYSLVSSHKSFDECLYKENNFHLLSACNGNLDLFDSSLNLEEIIIDIISTHEQTYDFIFLDCPAGLTKEALTLNAYCDHRLFVVTPDRSSITDSYSLMKVLKHKYGINENHLIVNMYQSHKQYEQVVKTMSETVESFLAGRTLILGGVEKLDIMQSRFDQFLLEEENNSTHKNFLKIIKKYTDELFRNFNTQKSFEKSKFEHEVQPFC